jgi:hypothetical protein
MIGPMSSSLALAQRTATKARAAMDTMSRQIATAQKVSSVKDDGAAWAQASAARTQQAEIAGRARLVDFVRLAVTAEQVEHDIGREQMVAMRDTLMRALDSAPGSQARSMLHAEFQQQLQAVMGISADTGPIETGYALQADGQWGILSSAADTVFNGKRFFASLRSPVNNHIPYIHFDYVTWSNYGSGSGPKFNEINLETANNATIIQALGWIDGWYLGGTLPYYSAEVSSQLRWLDQVESRDAQTFDRLDSAIGAMTDVDLGAASTQLRQAESRQQLALATVQQAISAYGNFAGGLLGNVQRTQRGVLA